MKFLGRSSALITLLFVLDFLKIFISSPIMAQQGNKYVNQITISGDHRIIAITYSTGRRSESTIERYSSVTGSLIDTVDLSPAVPNLISLSPTGDRIAYVGTNSEIGFYDTQLNSKIVLSQGNEASIDALAWNPTNNEIAWAIGSAVFVSDVAANMPSRTISATSGRIVEIAWSPDGTHLATSHYSEDAFNPAITHVSVAIWDLATSNDLISDPSFVINDRGGGSIEWSPDGTQLAILQHNKVSIFDVNDTTTVELSFDEESPSTVAWNKDGNRLAVGGDIIRVWDTTTWQIIKTIPVDGDATTMQWSLNGDYIFNDGGQSGLYLDTVPVSEIRAPIANAGIYQPFTDIDNNGSESVMLDGSASSDSDGTVTNYKWTENGTLIAVGERVQVTLSVGVHTITLMVTDNDGASAIDETVVTVNASQAIAIGITAPAEDDITISASDQTRFQIAAHDPNIGTADGAGIQQVEFELYDSANALIYSSSDTVAPYCLFGGESECNTGQEHFTGPNGTYALRARAQATAGNWTEWVSRTFVLDITTNQPPVANAGADQTVTAADGVSAQVTLDASGSSDSDGSIVAYRWTENGTEVANIIQPTISLSVGVHTITLTVTDDDGATDTDEVAITVNAAPTAFPANPVLDDFNRADGSLGA